MSRMIRGFMAVLSAQTHPTSVRWQGTFSSFVTPLVVLETTTFSFMFWTDKRFVHVEDESWVNLLDELLVLLKKGGNFLFGHNSLLQSRVNSEKRKMI